MRPHDDVRTAIWVWGVLASLSLAAGFAFADSPSHPNAYLEVRNWVALWHNGVNVYEVPKLNVDYPPNALVFLSPMLWLPAKQGELWFAALNIGICAATAWMIVALTSWHAGVPLSRVERLAYVLMLLVWSPTRVAIWNGQTSPLLILCCCLSLRLSEWSPTVAGICMASGLSKPHVALGFVLLAAFCRMWQMLAVSIISVVAAAAIYCAAVWRAPGVVLHQYVGNLLNVYGGPTFLRAEIDIRPFFVDLFRHYTIGEPLYLLAAAALAATLLYLAWRARNIPAAGVWVMAAGLMWSVAIFPFRRYGMFLLAPTVLLVLWRPALSESMMTLVGSMIFLVAADLPFFAQHAIMAYGSPTIVRYAFGMHYINRFVTVACLVTSFVTLARLSRRDALARTSG